MTAAHYLLFSALLAWFMLVTAATLRSRGWTFAGLKLDFSNREAMPEPTPLAARSDRAARNMLENLALFIAVYVASASFAGNDAVLTPGAAIFFWSRLAYFVVYLAGITYIRTFIWVISLVGMGMMVMDALV